MHEMLWRYVHVHFSLQVKKKQKFRWAALPVLHSRLLRNCKSVGYPPRAHESTASIQISPSQLIRQVTHPCVRSSANKTTRQLNHQKTKLWHWFCFQPQTHRNSFFNCGAWMANNSTPDRMKMETNAFKCVPKKSENSSTQLCSKGVQIGCRLFSRYLFWCDFVDYFVLLMSSECGPLSVSACPCPPVFDRATEGWTRR